MINRFQQSYQFVIAVIVFFFFMAFYIRQSMLFVNEKLLFEKINLNVGSDISKITIRHKWSSWSLSGENNYVILKKGDAFTTDKGKTVSSDKVAGLVHSLVSLKRSGGIRSQLTRDSSSVTQVGFQCGNGDKVLLFSTGCGGPPVWNIIYNRKLYVQYNGKFTRALDALLHDVAPSHRDLCSRIGNQISVSHHSNWVLKEFNSVLHVETPKPEINEKKVYLKILLKSALFKPIRQNYKVRDIALDCSLSKANPDCDQVEGYLSAESRRGKIAVNIPVGFEKDKIAKLYFDLQDATNTDKIILAHPFVKKVKALSRGMSVQVNYRLPGPYLRQSILTNIGKITSPYHSRISMLDRKMEVTFSFFNKNANALITTLEFRGDGFERYKDRIGMHNLVRLYQVPGYEDFTEDNILDFRTGDCNFIQATFKKDVLDQNPGYLNKLRQKYPDLKQFDERFMKLYYARLSISGYCVFMDKNGEITTNKLIQEQ